MRFCWIKLPPGMPPQGESNNAALAWAFKRCFDVFAALVGALSLGLVPVQASAAEKDLTNKGEVLVKENCSRCHAIGKEGNSPHPEAPPFRTLSSRYPIEDLSESLAEGIVSGHPDMPIFVFGPADVEAIIDYLNSIQEKPSPNPPAQ